MRCEFDFSRIIARASTGRILRIKNQPRRHGTQSFLNEFVKTMPSRYRGESVRDAVRFEGGSERHIKKGNL